MLNKSVAVELQNFILNSDWYTVDRLSIKYVNNEAKKYLREYCSPRDILSDVFTEETIAYSYALLVGLK
jgi:hypothetical protein